MLSSSGVLVQGHSFKLFDRELSWIAFNRRSFYEAAEIDHPALERLLKLAQTCAALDEYFMVRVPLLKGHHHTAEKSGKLNAFHRIQAYVRSLVARQQGHFAFNVKPHLAQQGIYLLNYDELTDIQRGQFHRRFEEEIAPVLMPLLTPPAAPMPDFSNLSLNLAVRLATSERSHLAWVKVPRSMSRFWLLPSLQQVGHWLVLPLEQVIAAHLASLFPGFDVQGAFSFRVTRSADLGTLDAETANLMELIQDSLQQRQQQGRAVRLEVDSHMPADMRSRLLSHLHLTPADLYSLPGWLGLSDLSELTRLPRPDLAVPPWDPVLPAALAPPPPPVARAFARTLPKVETDLFALLRSRDLLVHLPYHSFTDTVEKFVAQAAVDPAVLTIKMTLYRTAGDAPIVRSLIAAAKAGKQIVVLVELTASLDEAINIHWAQSLEKAGAHVVYGVVGFKTHTNLVLVVRREQGQIRQYAYVGTGDYLPDRPQPYEDLGFLTSQPLIGRDLGHLFNFLTGCSRQVSYQTLMVAPETMRQRLKQLIQREADHAQAGQPARLIVKLNLLADPDIIDALYAASQVGVEIDLIVRSICRLRPGVPGLSDRIRVVSILGRYVEHSRILYCENGGQSEVWFGTADWTPRGLGERIEVMAPIQSPDLIADIRQRLNDWLADTQNTWVLQPDGRYLRRQTQPSTTAQSVHYRFMAQASQTGGPVSVL